MKKRIIASIALLALFLIAVCSCAEEGYGFAGTSYIYEKPVGDGAFVININEDKTFSYLADVDGNYANGSWDYADGVLTLTEIKEDDTEVVNYFVIEENTIIFIAHGSDNFAWPTELEDGDRFFDMRSK